MELGAHFSKKSPLYPSHLHFLSPGCKNSPKKKKKALIITCYCVSIHSQFSLRYEKTTNKKPQTEIKKTFAALLHRYDHFTFELHSQIDGIEEKENVYWTILQL
jgi:hypothetical protein